MAKKDFYFDRRWPRGVAPAQRWLILDRDPGEDAPVSVPFPKPRPEPPVVSPIITDPRPKPVVPRGAVPPVKDMPPGPFDPRESLAWDEHVYPDAPTPPKLPGPAQLDLWLCVQSRRFVDERGRPYPKGSPPDRELPPGEEPPLLPEWLTRSEWDELDAKASASLSPGWVKAEHADQMKAQAIRLESKALDLLDDYLRAAGIRYFSARELTQHKWRHARGRVTPMAAWWFLFDYFEPALLPSGVFASLPRYVIPPPELWPNILPALRILDRFRHWLGEPVFAASGYRHPWYNKQLGGSQPDERTGDVGSFHMHFSAIDFYYRRWTSAKQLDTSVFVDWFTRLYRRVGDGVGRYGGDYGRFIHLDVGHRRDLLRKMGQNKADDWWRPRDYRGLLP